MYLHKAQNPRACHIYPGHLFQAIPASEMNIEETMIEIVFIGKKLNVYR